MTRELGCKVLLITGELSGDLYGSLLVKRIREKSPYFHFVGIGGPKIRNLGIEMLFSAESLSLVGIPTFSDFKKYWFVYQTLKEFLRQRKIDLVILIDFPGFNLRIANLAKKMGYPVIYYVAPQVWAWHKRRIKILKKSVDRLYVILPFEKEFFSSYGINTLFLGHPLLDVVKSHLSEEIFFEIYKLDPQLPLVSFFPGSRDGEIKRHLPLFIEVFKNLKKKQPKVQGIMVKASGLSDHYLWQEAKKYLTVVENSQYDVLKYSTVSLLASGTITLEAAIMETPSIVTYSLPSWVYFLAKKLIKVPYISLPNLILGKEVYPEILHEKGKVESLVKKLEEYLEDPSLREKVKNELIQIKQKIGPKGASWRIAEDMLKYISTLKLNR